MKLLISLLFILFFSVHTFAQSFTDKLYVIPKSSTLVEHRWSSEQGLDFDIVNYQTNQGKGVYMYIGVSENTRTNFEKSFYTPILGEPVKVYEQCESKNCRYSALVNTQLVSHGREIWAQIWVETKKGELNMYLDWLANLSFSLKDPK